ncbi:Ldh family oxidoreductase [Kitasatospora sp. LaBMicrA B282]|uniref:Ldh family oxidoreductase n=1 Tax=Kitasatospora sp. LaBMicrA B282 TaxID=3420949 RepID=UPI003D140B47
MARDLPAAGRPPVRIVVVTGAPGAGKTEVGRRLVRRYRCPAALIDTDAVADIYPWRADEKLTELIGRNLRACLRSYLDWGARVVVLSGVLLPGRTLDQFADLIADPGLDWVSYGLQARPERLAARILADTKVQEADGRMSWSHLDRELPGVAGIRLVDTNELTLDQVVDRIAAAEAADLGADLVPGTAAAPSAGPVRRVGVTEAAEVCTAALANAGFPAALAAEAAAELVDAELAGQASHGLLRVPEYLAAVAAGQLDPTATPTVHRTGEGAVLVEGERAPGVLVRRHLVEELAKAATGGPVLVGLRAAGHLGRLAPLAREVAGRGLALVGFVNFCGAGQKVAPAGGSTGRWATNPVVLACPAPPGPPLVIDLSTSAAAEGVVRAALLAGRTVPHGLLVGPTGASVTDPALLYTDPPGAALRPLGGVAEHKGHALAAFVETMAGIVAGAGHAAEPQAPGNGALFLAFPVEALGRRAAHVGQAVSRLEEHLRAAAPAPGRPAPRLPGRGAHPGERADHLTVPSALWSELHDLARPARLPTTG